MTLDEEFGLPGYHLDSESLLLATRDVDGFEFTALDTLQHRLAGGFRSFEQGQRQMTEAFPWDTAPRYLLRDRDAGFPRPRRGDGNQGGRDGSAITLAQNPYVERVIGSIRRECLNHVIIFDERHLCGVLSSYFHYYHQTKAAGTSVRFQRRPERAQAFFVLNDRWSASEVHAAHSAHASTGTAWHR
jgi:hypothetical protein